MAFVYRQERKIELSGKEHTQLGPGAYIGHKDYRPKPQVHEPFQAQTGRDTQSKTVIAQTVYNPGPGSYQPAVGFDQISKSMQSVKNLSMYGLEKFGVSVMKPTNCFASSVKRFNEKEIKEKAITPGPGQYAKLESWTRQKRNGPKPGEWQHVVWNKMTNPPSIPSHNNRFGYEENDRGELIKQKNAEEIISGVKSDTVGPGQYDVVKSLASTNKAPTWHVPKPKKKPPTVTGKQEQTVALPGPGTYNADKVDIFPIYKYKPSSVFVSKVQRDVKPAKKPMSQQNTVHNMLYDDYDDADNEDDDDEGTTPGPGQYWNPQMSTTFKVKPKPERLQFFGSTVERFAEQQLKQKASSTTNNLGPGSYSVTASLAGKNKATAVPFTSSELRFAEQKKDKVEVPGPGAYQQKTLVEDLSKKPWGKQGVFGSTEKRFVQAQVLVVPGPGQYKPERALHVLDKKKDNNIKRSSSMFLSGTKRNPYDEANKPPMLQYDVQSNTISDQVRKKIEAGIGNPLLANLKAKRGINPAFTSNAPRFKEKKVDEAEAYLGPGYYEQQSTFEKKVANRGGITQAVRFSDKTQGNEIPGPGHYSNDDLNNWFKRSYNMIFTE